MKRGSLFFLFAFISLSSLGALADELRLGVPEYGGSGCPAGSARVDLNAEQSSIHLDFDSYAVEVAEGRNFARKSCSLAIPIHVPSGYSASIATIDYRGFLALPEEASAKLNVEYFLAGQTGIKNTFEFSGPSTSDYLSSDAIAIEGRVWTACGEDTILRTNSSMLVKTNSAGAQAMATVDSLEINSGMVYQIELRKCGDSLDQ